MPVTLSWQHVAIRLALTVVAGFVIGFNRGEHGRAAGLRTTILVCLAAAVSMIQANLLMDTVGKSSDSFIVLDLMRLPLGILSGMGFIGAGAILRKGNLVVGVTTAATLWFSTVMGLCFGGGQLGLGGAVLVLGLGTLWGLKYVEGLVRQDVRSMVVLTIAKDGPSDDQISARITENGCKILSWGITYDNRNQRRQVQVEIERRILPHETQPPPFVQRLARDRHVEDLKWLPHGQPGDSPNDQAQPQGTPIPISAAK